MTLAFGPTILAAKGLSLPTHRMRSAAKPASVAVLVATRPEEPRNAGSVSSTTPLLGCVETIGILNLREISTSSSCAELAPRPNHSSGALADSMSETAFSTRSW